MGQNKYQGEGDEEKRGKRQMELDFGLMPYWANPVRVVVTTSVLRLSRNADDRGAFSCFRSRPPRTWISKATATCPHRLMKTTYHSSSTQRFPHLLRPSSMKKYFEPRCLPQYTQNLRRSFSFPSLLCALTTYSSQLLPLSTGRVLSSVPSWSSSLMALQNCFPMYFRLQEKILCG